jgi:cytochrome c oxidase subunit I+III
VLDARPEETVPMPEESWLPLAAALAIGVVFVGLLLGQPIIVGVGVAAALAFVAVWLWRTGGVRA